MPETMKKTKRVRKPKKQKVKQGHKLVWITLIIILVPVAIISYVLLESAQGNDKPVEGNRFGQNDLNPKIQDAQINSIQGDLMSIGGMESATVDLKSATLRINLNLADSANEDLLEAAAVQAYDIVNNYLPIDSYFTNPENGKNYDLEIGAYNYIVDDAHPQEGWQYVKLTKTSAASDYVIDRITSAKNPELAEQVRNKDQQIPQAEQPAEEAPAEEAPAEEAQPEEAYGYYDEYGNFYYF